MVDIHFASLQLKSIEQGPAITVRISYLWLFNNCNSHCYRITQNQSIFDVNEIKLFIGYSIDDVLFEIIGNPIRCGQFTSVSLLSPKLKIWINEYLCSRPQLYS